VNQNDCETNRGYTDDGVKIVRDGLVDRIPKEALRNEGSTEAVLSMLQAKITEETGEFAASGWTDPKELADALEVLHALARHSGIEWEVVETARIEKRTTHGGFETGLVYDRRLDPTTRRKDERE
jgi:predicted house-cleaning noncanonical NTP pyrophosphatase (MazG superfamily)